MDDTILNFNYPTDTPKIIKVIGVESVWKPVTHKV